ncbi:MAG: sensor histidine kinase N-terminal domain-containing protein [Burkholderiales bacterium]|nr:sensor histidine kinase N-terminal domain-containing protein [Burkholderiales bacterium]
MSLQRRLLLYLLVCAPVVWSIALGVSAHRARHEVNELFDTEIIRLALQVQSTLGDTSAPGRTLPRPPPAGEADLRDLAIAAWNRQGERQLVDREGALLPRRADASGFVDMSLGGEPWRVYYLPSPQGDWLVAAGQKGAERDELVRDLVYSQLVPWLLVLPVLLVAMAWSVKRALLPLRALTDELQRRSAEDLRPVPAHHAPQELQPMLQAMNGLFSRIGHTLERERRFTADAAHELRTPLAVLRAQWDVLKRSRGEAERAAASARLDAGMDRLDRLVTQMLALSRLEATEQLPQASALPWELIVEQAMSDVLPLAERRHVELDCEWPPEGTPPLPVRGDAALMAVLLRNLLDNAVRYAPEGSTVRLRFAGDLLQVINDGPPLSAETRAHLGERFHRRDGQLESGSGLGVSIVQRIAALHGLQLHYGARDDGDGVVATLLSR